MSVYKLAAVLAGATLLLGACGMPDNPAGVAPGGNTGSSPDTPVSGGGGGQVHDAGPGKAQRVEPRPGMADLRRIAWEKARPRGAGHVDVFFWSGVEPCYVLDHVDVRYRPRSVTITLFEGHDPAEEDTACIEIAVRKVVRVDLEEPLGDRAIRDGAR